MSALRSSCSCSSRRRCVLNFHFWNVRYDSNSSVFGSLTFLLSVLDRNSCSARFLGVRVAHHPKRGVGKGLGAEGGFT